MAKRGNHALESFFPPIKDLLWVVVVVIALFAFYGFLILLVGSQNSIQLITILAWPTVVVIVLIVFRKPLTDFLQGIAGRVTKFSITQIFSVELSLPEASQPAMDQLRQYLLQELASGEVISDSLGPLLEQIESDKSLDYMIVDLEKGQKWLTSRLFIFALMLERMRGLRCLVFLGTRCNGPRSFVGIALPGEVRWALAHKYSWLEDAYVGAQVELSLSEEFKPNKELLRIQSKQGALIPFIAAKLVSTFLSRIQKDKDHPPDPASDWELLEKKQGSRSYWEHANWIDEARLASDLGDALHTSEEVCFKDSLDISQARRGQALLRHKGSSFVALIDRKGAFKSLIDREVLLEQVAERVEEASDDH
jgi:hypothetical protein